MMDIKQISKFLGVPRHSAKRMLDDARINGEKKPFKHGKKLYFNVTPERLSELEKKQDPEYVAMKQSEALAALELVFRKTNIGN